MYVLLKVSENGEILEVVKKSTEINLGVDHVIDRIVFNDQIH